MSVTLIQVSGSYAKFAECCERTGLENDSASQSMIGWMIRVYICPSCMQPTYLKDVIQITLIYLFLFLILINFLVCHVQVIKTPTYPVICRYPLYDALRDHNPLTLQTDWLRYVVPWKDIYLLIKYVWTDGPVSYTHLTLPTILRV